MQYSILAVSQGSAATRIPLTEEWSSSTGEGHPLWQARIFGENARGAVREGRDTHLASQTSLIDPGDQWDDRCHSQITLTFNKNLTCGFHLFLGVPDLSGFWEPQNQRERCTEAKDLILPLTYKTPCSISHLWNTGNFPQTHRQPFHCGTLVKSFSLPRCHFLICKIKRVDYNIFQVPHSSNISLIPKWKSQSYKPKI